jgi:hypothetical protein
VNYDERAHAVIRAWLLETPAVDAQIRTTAAQRSLEALIASALREAHDDAQASVRLALAARRRDTQP